MINRVFAQMHNLLIPLHRTIRADFYVPIDWV